MRIAQGGQRTTAQEVAAQEVVLMKEARAAAQWRRTVQEVALERGGA